MRWQHRFNEGINVNNQMNYVIDIFWIWHFLIAYGMETDKIRVIYAPRFELKYLDCN